MAMCDKMAEDILKIADTPVDGDTIKIYKDGGKEITKSDMVNHRRLQIEARKWLLSKVAPKKYGDKLELSGDEKAPLSIIIRGDDAKL